jgi:hypothetical protein
MGDPYFDAPLGTLLALATVPDSTATTASDQSAATTIAIDIVPTMSSALGTMTLDHTMATPLTVLSLVVVSATWTTY